MITNMGNYKTVTADNGKILTLPDGAVCASCYMPLTADTSGITETDYVAVEVEPTEAEAIKDRVNLVAERTTAMEQLMLELMM